MTKLARFASIKLEQGLPQRWTHYEDDDDCGPRVQPRSRRITARPIAASDDTPHQGSAIADLAMLLAQNLSQATRLASLESKFEIFAHAAAAASTSITVLAEPTLHLLKPIPVMVRQVGDDEFTATFFDAAIESNGETETAAFRNLVDLIESKFLVLSKLPESDLAMEMLRQLTVLRHFIAPAN